MVQGSKRTLKHTGEHNLDLEKMQFEKDKGNVSRTQDYVNKETKAKLSKLQWKEIEKSMMIMHNIF